MHSESYIPEIAALPYTNTDLHAVSHDGKDMSHCDFDIQCENSSTFTKTYIQICDLLKEI